MMKMVKMKRCTQNKQINTHTHTIDVEDVDDGDDTHTSIHIHTSNTTKGNSKTGAQTVAPWLQRGLGPLDPGGLAK